MSQRLVKRALKLKAEIEQIKPLYAEYDSILKTLRAKKFKSGFGVKIKDNFKNKDIGFKTVAFSRYSLEET